MVRILTVCLYLLLAPLAAQANDYPSRSISLVVGFPAGGSLDAVVRRIAERLTIQLKVPVVVDNKPGATGTIAASLVSQAAPDGYTLLFGVAGNLSVAPVVLKHVTYDPVKSFSPIVQVARGPYVLLVRSELPIKSVRDIAKYAAAQPDGLDYGSAGVGSVQHFSGELLRQATGAKLTHIPYKGGAQAYAGMMGGEIDLFFDTMPGPLMYAKTGKIRPIAVTGSARLPALPDVPTFVESGLPTVEVGFMYGILAPAGTPRPIVDRMNKEVTEALNSAELKEAFSTQNVEPSPGTPESFGELIASELKRWREIVKLTKFEPS